MCNALPNFVHKDVLPPEILDVKPIAKEVSADGSNEPEANGEDEEPVAVDDEAANFAAGFDCFASDDEDDDDPPPTKSVEVTKPVDNGVTKHEEEK